jgi:hypothetical protein
LGFQDFKYSNEQTPSEVRLGRAGLAGLAGLADHAGSGPGV